MHHKAKELPYKRVEHIGDHKQWVRIYALCEYPGFKPRYIGKTVRYMHERHKQHIRVARKQNRLPVHRWINKQIRENKWLAIKLIEFVKPGDDWVEREVFWINKLKTDGHDLLNLTNGGEGLPGHKFTDDHKQKISDALYKQIEIACDNCGKPVLRKPAHIRNHTFCNRNCYCAWQTGRKNKNKGQHMGAAGRKASAIKRRNQTHCKRGHPLYGDNLFYTAAGGRGCKECRKKHKRDYLARKAAKEC